MLSQVALPMGRIAPVALRVNPDVEAGSHAKISTGAAHNKFGVAIADLVAACARISELPGLELQGVAVHIGSQLPSLAPLETAFERLGTDPGAEGRRPLDRHRGSRRRPRSRL